jgi:hypothetical protein
MFEGALVSRRYRMVVTDYRTKDSAELLSDGKADEWRRLAAECGLTALLEKQDAGDVALGWTKMDNQTTNALKWLCPQTSTLDKYKHDVPPIEALGLITNAQMRGEFDKIEIHFHDRLPDPVAVGTKGEDKYLICAWGPEEMPPERWAEVFRERVIAGFEAYKERVVNSIRALTADNRIEQWLRYGWNDGVLDVGDMR